MALHLIGPIRITSESFFCRTSIYYVKRCIRLNISFLAIDSKSVTTINLEENLLRVKKEIERCAVISGRDANSVKLIAVSKTRSLEEVESVVSLGQICLGENTVQDGILLDTCSLKKQERYPAISNGSIRSIVLN